MLALSLVSLLNDTSSEIIYPLLPIFLSLTLSASPFAIGTIEGAAESISSLLKLVAGRFSDRSGQRKATVLAGYGLSSLIRPFIGFAASWQHVLFLRLTDRTGKGIRSAPRDAIVADSITPEKRGLAFGFHRAMDNTGAVLGPLVAFFLLNYLAADNQKPTAREYQLVFLLASVPAFFALLVILFFVRENPASNKNSKTEDQRPKTEDQKPPFDKNLRNFLIILIIFTLANSSDAFLLLRAQEVGISPYQIPLLWMLHNLIKVVSSLIGGDLSDRIGRKRLILAGWIVYALVYAGFAFASNSATIWILFALYGVYFGLTEGAEKALVADLAPKEKRGTAFGWYHLAYGIAVFPASLLTGWLWKNYGAQTAFLVAAAFAAVAAALLSFIIQHLSLNGKNRIIEQSNNI